MKTSRLVTAIICIVSSVAATKDLIVTWGGNRVSSQTQDPNYYEPSLEALCSKSNYASTVHIMGVLQFYGPNNKIGIGLANHCNRVYPGFVKPSSGYTLLSCPSIGAQIKKCQGLGKRVLISIVNSISPPVMKSDADGEEIADQLWNLFLGGTGSSVRPFGEGVVLDGVDIWMRDNQIAGYAAMATRLRELFDKNSGKKFLLAGSPRCSFPEPVFAAPGGPFDGSGSQKFDYISIYAESSPDCSFLRTELFLSTLGKWSDWSVTAGRGGSPLSLYLALPANNYVSAPGDYISIASSGVLSKLPSAITGLTINDYSIDIVTQPCKGDSRTYGQLMRDIFDSNSKVSCTPNSNSDGISGRPTGGDKGGSGGGGGGGNSDYDLSSATSGISSDRIQAFLTIITLLIAFFIFI